VPRLLPFLRGFDEPGSCSRNKSRQMKVSTFWGPFIFPVAIRMNGAAQMRLGKRNLEIA